ncbi:hypothetical protein SCAPIOD30154 [Staphylococcus capitis]|nr:hypothetical protein SCAPIOD30154 [Staphylococcus capitis]CQD32457.1 hypothetical protein SCAPIOD30155 [Staphylococcus capitis]CRN11912.1 hypothetical protein BN151740155 [Staphylococcus capitis]CUT97909.1 hypothetical protein BN1318_80019 [Staphylococcus capitis]
MPHFTSCSHLLIKIKYRSINSTMLKNVPSILPHPKLNKKSLILKLHLKSKG